MGGSEHSLERKMAEFTEVHGAVLLGMHKELQSFMLMADKKIESSQADLRNFAQNSIGDLQRYEGVLNYKQEQIDRQINGFEGRSKQITQTLEKEFSSSIKKIHELKTELELFINHKIVEMDKQEEQIKETKKEVELIKIQASDMMKNLKIKIKEHQQREANFNKIFRHVLILIASITAIACLAGVLIWMR